MKQNEQKWAQFIAFIKSYTGTSTEDALNKAISFGVIPDGAVTRPAMDRILERTGLNRHNRAQRRNQKDFLKNRQPAPEGQQS